MSVVPPHCQPLNSTMCKNLYIYVEMPNFWGDNTQEEADARIQVFSPLVNSGCSPSLRVFLCLLYFPPCVMNFRKVIPPCRGLCEDARRGCKPALEGAGFPWPEIMKCSQFPYYSKNESNVCLKPETKTTKGKKSLFLLSHYYYYYFYYVKFSTGILPGEKYPVKPLPETSDFQHHSEDMCRSEECQLLHRSCSVFNS